MIPREVLDVRIESCTFRGNRGTFFGASGVAAGIGPELGGPPLNLTVVDSSFIGNGPGSPLVNRRDPGLFVVEDAVFESNFCDDDAFPADFPAGSAIDVLSSSPNPTNFIIRRSRIVENRCPSGPAVRAYGADITIDRSVFARNEADFVSAGLVVAQNIASTDGRRVTITRTGASSTTFNNNNNNNNNKCEKEKRMSEREGD